MTAPDEHLLKVSDDPTEAINEVALDELNRIHRRVADLEGENIAFKRRMGEMQKSLDRLWAAYNSHPRQ